MKANMSLWLTGRVDNVHIDSSVTNHTLDSLHPATEYVIKLSTVRSTQESDPVTTRVFTGVISLSSCLSACVSMC